MHANLKKFFNIYLNKGGKNIDNKYETKKNQQQKICDCITIITKIIIITIMNCILLLFLLVVFSLIKFSHR